MIKLKHDEQYRRNAVSLVESGKSKAQVARELNIPDHLIYSWCKKYGSNTPGNAAANQEEVTRLRKQLERAEAELDILKKAMSIFSRPNK